MRTDAREISRTSRLLHWVVACALLLMIAFGLWVASLDRGPLKTEWVQLHKSFGMIAAGLIIARLVWRMHEGFPQPLAPQPAWKRRLARVTHIGLLVISLALPLTGILKSVSYARPVAVFGLEIVPKVLMKKNEVWNDYATLAHAWLAWGLIGLVALHTAVAVWHHFAMRDATLRRMIWGH